MFDTTTIYHDVLPSGAASLVMDNSVDLNVFIKSQISLIYEEQRLVNEAYDKLYNEFLVSRERYDKDKIQENYRIFFTLINKLWNKEKVLVSNMKEVIKYINN